MNGTLNFLLLSGARTLSCLGLFDDLCELNGGNSQTEAIVIVLTSFMLLPVVSYKKKNCRISSNFCMSLSDTFSCMHKSSNV